MFRFSISARSRAAASSGVAAACPTGAAAYALPPSDALLGEMRVLLAAYREAAEAERS